MSFSISPFTALDGQAPDEFYFANLPALQYAVQAQMQGYRLKKRIILPPSGGAASTRWIILCAPMANRNHGNLAVSFFEPASRVAMDMQ